LQIDSSGVVHNLNIARIFILPAKTDPVLVINADSELPLSITSMPLIGCYGCFANPKATPPRSGEPIDSGIAAQIQKTL
jgi:hypothetical protein